MTQTHAAEDIEFDRMTAMHRGARRGYWLYAVILAILASALIITSLLGMIPWIIGMITGIVALAVAILPMRQAIERAERIEGLAVLEEEWRELAKLGDSASDQKQQFLTLLRRLYS